MAFSSLPVEIKEHIFNLLPPEDLWTCLSVCRDWRTLLSSERIWKTICQKHQMDMNYFEDGEICNLKLCKHALLWKCNNETFSRWHSNTVITQLIPYDSSEEITCTRIFVFKKKMALISDKIELYSFSRKTHSCETISLPFIPHAVTMNNKYIVCTYGNIALIHKKEKLFKRYCAIALSKNLTLDIKTEKIKSFIDNKHKFGPYIKTEALVGEYLWISCSNTDSHPALLIINLKDLTVNHTNLVSKLLSVTRQKVIVSTHDKVYVYNFKGDLQLKLDFPSLFRATDHFIITFPRQGEVAKVWAMDGTYIQTLPGLVMFKLDPTRHLIYSCQRGECETDCKLSAVSLKTGVLSWFTVMRDVKFSEIDDMFLVCDKFLVIDVYIDIPTPNFHFGLVFDLDAKTLLYKTNLKGFTMFVSNYLWVQKRQNDLIVNVY